VVVGENKRRNRSRSPNSAHLQIGIVLSRQRLLMSARRPADAHHAPPAPPPVRTGAPAHALPISAPKRTTPPQDAARPRASPRTPWPRCRILWNVVKAAGVQCRVRDTRDAELHYRIAALIQHPPTLPGGIPRSKGDDTFPGRNENLGTRRQLAPVEQFRLRVRRRRTHKEGSQRLDPLRDSIDISSIGIEGKLSASHQGLHQLYGTNLIGTFGTSVKYIPYRLAFSHHRESIRRRSVVGVGDRRDCQPRRREQQNRPGQHDRRPSHRGRRPRHPRLPRHHRRDPIGRRPP
jgi:hypothetical protein